jgi:hypothetical protein
MRSRPIGIGIWLLGITTALYLLEREVHAEIVRDAYGESIYRGLSAARRARARRVAT